MKFKDYKYQRPDLEDAKVKVENLIKTVKEADDFEKVKEAFLEYNKIINSLSTQFTIASVRHSINTKDEFYEKENDWMDENGPFLTQIDTEFKKAVLASKFLEDLKKVFPLPFFQMAENAEKAFNEEILEDLQEENKLQSEYDKLIASCAIDYKGEIRNLPQMMPFTISPDRAERKEATDKVWDFFKENEEKFDQIYDSMVKIRTKIAKKLGFSSFTELAYVRMNRLDYNQDMVANYRKQIADVIVPICNKLYKEQAKKLSLESLSYYDTGLMFPDGNAKPNGTPEEILDAGKRMYHEISPETAEFIDLMLDNELMDVLAKPGKRSGGYMTFIPDYKVPFIFSNFNGTSGDVDVLTHEAGHAFQGYQSRNIEVADCVMPTYESCEIHSMSMEFFAWPHIEKFFGDQERKYKYAHLAGALKFLPYGVQVDHFQHEVYNNPDMTPDERKALWRELDKVYRPHLDYSENDFADKGTFFYRQGHIFTSPFYYIDYTLAQVCAFQFWKRLQDEDPKAWEDYLKICKIGGTKSFLGIVKEANLISPFEDGCLSSIAGSIENWLEKVDYQSI